MLKTKKNFAVAVIVLFASLHMSIPASGQEHRQGQRIVTRTRLQVLFSDLEGKWLKAIQDKDQGTLNRLLPDEFQVWTPAPPGSPIAREDWLKSALARKLQSFQFRQMAVRSVSSETSIASFVLTETFQKAGKPQSEEHFIVDVWMKSPGSEDWKCTDRYSWELGQVPNPPDTQEAKPSGKQYGVRRLPTTPRGVPLRLCW